MNLFHYLWINQRSVCRNMYTYSISNTRMGSVFCLSFSELKKSTFLLLTTTYCLRQPYFFMLLRLGTANQPSMYESEITGRWKERMQDCMLNQFNQHPPINNHLALSELNRLQKLSRRQTYSLKKYIERLWSPKNRKLVVEEK